ncbi:hypothetical protein [Roseomonas sp. BN140053]|uniref:hypothetical protein n=1 Tax=Roseomonas sp. BN140053 TaxID=3391898 RepID=UPI0039EA899C
MPALLTTGDTLLCSYGGKVTLAGAPKLRIAGGMALTASHVKGCPVVGCGAGASSLPLCTAVSDVSGAAAKLQVAGEGVLLPPVSGQASVPPPPGGPPGAAGPPPHPLSLGPGSPLQSKVSAA